MIKYDIDGPEWEIDYFSVIFGESNSAKQFSERKHHYHNITDLNPDTQYNIELYAISYINTELDKVVGTIKTKPNELL